MHFTLTVNGIPRRLDVDPGERLLDLLRERLALTGTKEGCGEGECGACSVLIDGTLAVSCLVPMGQLDGVSVVTIEGLTRGDAVRLLPLQEALLAAGGAQCGICTPGIVVAAHALLQGDARPALDEIRDALAGNICRCTGYTAIYEAIQRTAEARVTPREPPLSVGDGVTDHAGPLHDAPRPRRSGTRWARPQALAEALRLLAADPSLVPIAGGTDLMVAMAQSDGGSVSLLDLSGIPELRTIVAGPSETIVGGLTTYGDVARHPAITERHSLLIQAARQSGAWAIQNRGTLGGNIANASPAADSPPALLAYGARLELASVRGARWIDYVDFHLDYKQTVRAVDELITRIAVPVVRPDTVQFYRKVGTRRAQAISKVCFAAVATPVGDGLADVRIALGSVAPTVVSARETARYLMSRPVRELDRGQARAILASEITPIDDVRSTAVYRGTVAGNLLEQFLDEISGR